MKTTVKLTLILASLFCGASLYAQGRVVNDDLYRQRDNSSNSKNKANKNVALDYKSVEIDAEDDSFLEDYYVGMFSDLINENNEEYQISKIVEEDAAKVLVYEVIPFSSYRYYNDPWYGISGGYNSGFYNGGFYYGAFGGFYPYGGLAVYNYYSRLSFISGGFDYWSYPYGYNPFYYNNYFPYQYYSSNYCYSHNHGVVNYPHNSYDRNTVNQNSISDRLNNSSSSSRLTAASTSNRGVMTNYSTQIKRKEVASSLKPSNNLVRPTGNRNLTNYKNSTGSNVTVVNSRPSSSSNNFVNNTSSSNRNTMVSNSNRGGSVRSVANSSSGSRGGAMVSNSNRVTTRTVSSR